eukprot:5984477-Pyramimonas_sp.AAC.1
MATHLADTYVKFGPMNCFVHKRKHNVRQKFAKGPAVHEDPGKVIDDAAHGAAQLRPTALQHLNGAGRPRRRQQEAHERLAGVASADAIGTIEPHGVDQVRADPQRRHMLAGTCCRTCSRA